MPGSGGTRRMVMQGKRRLEVRVVPNAARDEIVGWQGSVLKIKLQAVPEDGKANKALCAFLARELGCHRREVVILTGEKSRNKLLELPAETAARWPIRP